MTTFKPHVPANKKMREFSLRAIILGCLLSLIFGLGNTYLALKLGITISASIPAAVISMTIMRSFFKRATILENNLVQTVASVGEGLAAGVAFTAPALFILGAPISILQIFLLSLLGAILGILFMIPMRRYIIVKEHGKLPFPEGVACAKILEAGARGGNKATLPIIGIITGAIFRLSTSLFYLWNEMVSWKFPKLNTELNIDCSPALLGVGYIIGPRISSLLFFGGMLGWWVIIPLISHFGNGIVYPGTIPIERMSPDEVWSSYIRYIGAGAVAVGGLITLVKIFPLIGKTFREGFHELVSGAKHRKSLLRTDQDISLRWLILGSVGVTLFLWLFPLFPMNLFTVLLLVVLGLFFVAVASITVGMIGSTSNPVSGMTITILLVTCIIFVLLGWTERVYLLSAITMSIVANIAIALGATTSQDLKTGFMLGATPKKQQIGEIIGSILPALFIGGALYVLNDTYTFGSPQMPAPQGTLMALIAEGVISGKIPFFLVGIGVILGLFMEMLKLPVLPFAIGLYLPLSLSTGVMVGGVFSWIIRRKKNEAATNRGILAASGLVAGDACTGVLVALLAAVGIANTQGTGLLPGFVSLGMLLLVGVGLVKVSGIRR